MKLTVVPIINLIQCIISNRLTKLQNTVENDEDIDSDTETNSVSTTTLEMRNVKRIKSQPKHVW